MEMGQAATVVVPPGVQPVNVTVVTLQLLVIVVPSRTEQSELMEVCWIEEHGMVEVTSESVPLQSTCEVSVVEHASDVTLLCWSVTVEQTTVA